MDVLNIVGGVSAKGFIPLFPEYCELQKALALTGDSEKTKIAVEDQEKHTPVLI